MIFGEYDNFYRKSNAYNQFETTLKKNGGRFEYDITDIIRFVITAFVLFFKETTIMTNGGSKREEKNVWPVPTFIGVLIGEDRNTLSYFDKSNEDQFINTIMKEILIDNHKYSITREK